MVEAAAPRTDAPARALPLATLLALPARAVLAGVVGFSFLIRTLLALAHATPIYLPDEYIYATLARSIATEGRPTIRGELVNFPALLEPLLAAPLWLAGDAEIVYRLTQGLHALAMSLAAVPVYLLCRRLGLGKWFGLGAGVLAVALPSLVYSAYITADAVAYPLVLAAVYAGVRALDRPTPRAQLVFLALSGLAAFARVQYVVLPVAFLLASVVVERGSVRRAARSLRLSLVLMAIPVLGVVALGPARALGYYSAVTELDAFSLSLLQALGTQLMGVAYSAGWVVVPGALLLVALALYRPRSRAEAAFAALVSILGTIVFAQAALYALNTPERFKERYLIALLPLFAPAFGLYLLRGAPHRLAIAALSAGLLVLSVRVPLASYTVAEGKQDSPLLSAVFELEQRLGLADGALAVAVLAAVLSALALAIAMRPRRGAFLALVPAILIAVLASAGAHAHDRLNAAKSARTYLPANPQWIDDGPLRDVALLVTPGSPRGLGFQHLFWNRSIEDVLYVRDAEPIDSFGSSRVRIADDGRIIAGGHVVRQPLLVEQYGSATSLTGARRVASGLSFDLWQPAGVPRISTLIDGRYFDGWLIPEGTLTVWPDASGRARGTLRLVLTYPGAATGTGLRLEGPGLARTIEVPANGRVVFEHRISTSRPWTLRYRSTKPARLPDGRFVGVSLEPPVFDRSGDTRTSSS